MDDDLEPVLKSRELGLTSLGVFNYCKHLAICLIQHYSAKPISTLSEQHNWHLGPAWTRRTYFVDWLFYLSFAALLQICTFNFEKRGCNMDVKVQWAQRALKL